MAEQVFSSRLDEDDAEKLRQAPPMSYDEGIAILEQLASSRFSDLLGPGQGASTGQTPAVEPARWSGPPGGLLTVSSDGRITSFDPGAELIFKRAAAEVVGMPLDRLMRGVPPPGAGNRERTAELVGRRRDGSTFHAQLSSSEILVGAEPCLILYVRDVEREWQAEMALRGAEARYRNLVEQIPAVTFMASLDSGLNDIYVSPQIEALLGFSQDEWVRDPVLWYRQLHPDDRGVWNLEFARGCATGGPFRAECRFFARDGRVVWVHGEARLIRDEHGHLRYLQGVAFDISETKRAEEVVKASLLEKEVLLKEIHHRVKNNLQVTSSLLRLQAAKISDESARQLLKESQDRIRSMALVHEMLYQSADLSRVNFADYVRELVSQLFRSYTFRSPVRRSIEIMNITLGIDDAVPCGLIINELVSNSLKHAFPDDRTGHIRIGLVPIDEATYELYVNDDGVGLPAGFDAVKVQSLGIRLVRNLATQLGGKLRVEVREGTEFRVTFPRHR